MKLRSFFSTLIAVVLVLLGISAGGFYWLFAQNPLNLLQASGVNPVAAMFVPKQAPMMVSLLVNPDRLDNLRQVVTNPAERRRTRAESAQFKQSLLANTGLDYQRDIQPWLGEEITWAVTSLDSDRDRSNGQQPGYLLAIATKDPERSRQFLQLFWQHRAIAGTDLVFEQYKGVTLIYGNTVATQPAKAKQGVTTLVPSLNLATAVVGDQFVLFANQPKVLRDAINNVQAAELNLSGADFYARSLETLERSRIGLAFVNLPKLATWTATTETIATNTIASVDNPTSAKPEKSAGRKATVPVKPSKPETPAQTLAIALGVNSQGMMADTALLTLNGQTPVIVPALTAPVAALQYLPASAPISVMGADLEQVWQRLDKGLSGYETASQLLHQLTADLGKSWNLDLTEAVFPWVKGEYALGLLPIAQPSSVPQSEWIFVAEQPKTDAGRQAIAKLDEIAQQQGLTTGTLTIGDRTVSAWTRLTTSNKRLSKTVQAEVRGVHATVDNYEIFTTSVAAMEQALAAPADSLLKTDRFQDGILPFDQPNNGYGYLDWAAGRAMLEQQIPLVKVVELAGKPLFDHLRSLTFSSYGTQAGIQRGAVFLRLG
jgi:hypothetical protein